METLSTAPSRHTTQTQEPVSHRRVHADLPVSIAPFAIAGLEKACPVCLCADERSASSVHGGTQPERCPQCGEISSEYGITCAIDRVLAEMSGLERLAAAI